MSDAKKIFASVEKVIAQFDGLFELRDVLRDAVNAESLAEQAEERCAMAEKDLVKLQASLDSMKATAEAAMNKIESDHKAALEKMNADYDRAEASRRADHDATMKDLGDELTDTKHSLASEKDKLADVSSKRQEVQNELADLTAQLNALKQSVAAISA